MIALLLFLAQALAPLPPPRFDTYPVDLRVTATTAGARLRLLVRDPRSGAVVREFRMVHERPMDLFVISQALDFFAYEHPAPQPDAVFMVDVPLPRTGPYMAIAEFMPTRGTPQTFQQMFTTGEAFVPAPPPAVDLAAKVTGGVRVSLEARDVTSGERRPITVRLDDPATGMAVTDLEPYFGAAVHVVVVSADLTEAIHAFADQQGSGQGLTISPLLPRAGRYKAWIQFQRRGTVSTVSFVFEVR